MSFAQKREFVDSLAFTCAVTFISRLLVLRDRILGRIGKSRLADSQAASRHVVTNGDSTLDCVFVTPVAPPPRAAVLICHGIGETVDHWLGVQGLLAACGIASLVFDYSGYGKSTGKVHWRRCEEDAIAAFGFLEKLLPELPVSMLGFSLGSGIAASILNRIRPKNLILCAAFTSFREAVCSVGLPKRLSSLAPAIWNTRTCLRQCSCPVLIVHCDHDRLFPTQMASELASCCGSNGRLIVIPNQTHNEPFYRPQLAYWSNIVSFLLSHNQAQQ